MIIKAIIVSENVIYKRL